MELSASERAALLLAHSRYALDGRGCVWGDHEAFTADLDRLAEKGLMTVERPSLRGTITPEGIEQADAYCPVCGREIPQQDGRRPPHPGQRKVRGSTGTWNGRTREAPFWCTGGQSEDGHVFSRYDRQPKRGGKSTLYQRWYGN